MFHHEFPENKTYHNSRHFYKLWKFRGPNLASLSGTTPWFAPRFFYGASLRQMWTSPSRFWFLRASAASPAAKFANQNCGIMGILYWDKWHLMVV